MKEVEQRRDVSRWEGRTGLPGGIETQHEEPHLLVPKQLSCNMGLDQLRALATRGGGDACSPRAFERLAPILLLVSSSKNVGGKNDGSEVADREGRASLGYNRKNKSSQTAPPRDPSDTPTHKLRLDINKPPSRSRAQPLVSS